MHTVIETEPATDVPPAEAVAPVRWHAVTRIGFRFVVLYFTAYVLTDPEAFRLRWSLPWAAEQRLHDGVRWVATHLFGSTGGLMGPAQSGDKAYDFTLVFCLLVFSAAGTLLWSIVDRRRLAYVGLHKWYRVFLRFSLGATMVFYGMIKAFPVQMAYPGPLTLLEPYGHLSLQGVLWSKIGISPAYQMLTGVVELLVAALLFIPGLTTLGALVGLFATTQVFALNMTYDVPVKLFSFHLILIVLVLLAPDMRRLIDLLILNRPVGRSTVPPLARRRRLAMALVGAQLVAGSWLFWAWYGEARAVYATRQGPKPPLYGIWNITTMTVDGEVRPPLVTDDDRWRRMVIQYRNWVSFQKMDDTFQHYRADVDLEGRQLTLLEGADAAPSEIGAITIAQPAADRLVLEGTLDGRTLRMEMVYYDLSDFPLLQGRFRWVQETSS